MDALCFIGWCTTVYKTLHVRVVVCVISSQLKQPWNRSDVNDTTDNEKARRIYDYLLTITLRKPDSIKYQQFSSEVKRRALQQYGGDSIYGNEEVSWLRDGSFGWGCRLVHWEEGYWQVQWAGDAG